jgi:hypothetical protein
MGLFILRTKVTALRLNHLPTKNLFFSLIKQEITEKLSLNESNTPIFPTPAPSDSPVQPIPNQPPDPAPDKTGDNRETEFE